MSHKQPKEDPETQYKGRMHYSLLDDALGTYRSFSRIRQWMDKKSGVLPERGDKINVEFDDGSFKTYEVIDVRNILEAACKSADKYKFQCVIADTNENDEYPEKITIGARQGNYTS